MTNNLADNPYYAAAQEFISSGKLRDLPLGTHVLDEGNLWVNVLEVSLKSPAEAVLEAHDSYIDIQVPLTGSETYGVKPRQGCTPAGGFDEARDIVFFTDPVTETVTVPALGQITFTPETAHAPLIGEGVIRKAIFKVRVVG